MSNNSQTIAVNGIHHITAVATSAAENFRFYTRVLGLRLVKKTVNFDDPHTYHLYYGDHAGNPGTILTSVMLLLHQEIQLIYTVSPASVFFLVKFKRL